MAKRLNGLIGRGKKEAPKDAFQTADEVLGNAFTAFRVALQGTQDSIAVLDEHDAEQDALIAYAQDQKQAVAAKKEATQKLHDKLADFLS